MDVISAGLILLVMVAVSDLLSRLIPLKLPLQWYQIALGVLICSFTRFAVPLNPQVFFLLFVPPLLFLDGWRIPRDTLYCDSWTIVLLAIGLVFLTVTAIGPLVGWMIPGMPLAVAFALAAVLSPTDPIAVSSIASRSPISQRIMHILDGEALFNDASGLVCFHFALLAAATGNFSLAHATISFIAIAGGGMGIGAAVAAAIGLLNRLVVRKVGEESGVQILISVLTPFAAYLLAEHLGLSGILAAAAAGIVAHWLGLADRRQPATRLRSLAVWDTLQLSLNGVVFVLLGEQLPEIIRRNFHTSTITPHLGMLRLLGYVTAIAAGLIAVRFIWIWLSLRFTLFRTRRPQRRGVIARVSLLMSLAGVRGAVTLAAVLTLPTSIQTQGAFPSRDVAIFLAVGGILLSLVIASIALPIMARRVKFDPDPFGSSSRQAAHARVAAAEAALRRIAELRQAPELQDYSDEADRLSESYRRRIEYGQETADPDQSAKALQAERKLRLEALRAEREELDRLLHDRHLTDPLHRQLVRQIDLLEAGIARNPDE
jgi:CPA1 family monovalent cation:H+ antiporter